MGEYRLADTPSGLKTLIRTDGREIKLHSSYDPLKEAERSVNAFRAGRARIILVCGLGLGYHVRLLKERFPDHDILVCERDGEVVRIVRSACPGHIEETLLLESADRIPSIFESLDMSSFRGIAIYYHRPSYLIYKEYYDGLIREANRFVSSKLSDLLTRFEFEEKWIENIFANAPKLYSSSRVAGLFGAFRGYPGIIVSAGPSLRKNVDTLAKMHDRALIVAVDTALKVLLKRGIEPHIVMTIDAQKHSLRHFLGAGERSAWLLADMVSYPRISDIYRGGRIFSTTSKYYTGYDGRNRREPTPMMDWIEQFIEPVGDVQSGGSVATSAFDLLLNLGCSPILLVGQDLAYTGREIHCTGTYHNDEWLPKTSRFRNLDTINQAVIRRRKIKYVEAFGGNGTVISDYVFDLYKGWFEDSAGKVPFPVINATEGGARIRGTVERTLSELSRTLPAVKKDPGGVINEALCRQQFKSDALYSGVTQAITDVSGIVDLAGAWADGAGPEYREKLMAVLDDDTRSGIIAPFLRKTNAYLARHTDMDPEKAASMLAADIASASKKCLRLLMKCKKDLEAALP